MSVKPAFQAKVVGGKLRFSKPEALGNYIKKLEGKDVRVKIEQKTKSRSLSQNNYYWGVVIELIAEHLGYRADEVHDLMRAMFLPYSFVDAKRGINIQTARSTSSLTTVEFEEYIEKIRGWASSEQEIRIPLPNEVDLGEYELLPKEVS